MGGKPKTPEQKATPEEIERIKVAEEQWSFYEQYGRPVANRFTEMSTGYRVNDSGQLEVIENGLLNADGSVRTDASGAIAATEKAFSPTMEKFNPNSGRYRGGLVDLERAQMTAEGEAGAGIQLAQQNRGLKGLENAVALGRGEQTQAVSGLHELANNAHQKAGQDARDAFTSQSVNKSLGYQALGYAGAALTGQQRSGQGLGSLGRNTANNGLFSLKNNGLQDAGGNKYYDKQQDFYA